MFIPEAPLVPPPCSQGGGDRTVYRWHVDSLMAGQKDMDVVPLMEEGVGKTFFA